MSSTTDGRQATMDSTQIYREERYSPTARSARSARLDDAGGRGRLGGFRAAGAVRRTGRKVMTPMGAVPISFELDARDLERGHREIRRVRGIRRTTDHAANCRRSAGEQASSLGHPRRRRRVAAESERSARPWTAAALINPAAAAARLKISSACQTRVRILDFRRQ